jgi:collagen type III alpha
MTTTSNAGNYVDFDEYVGLKLEKTRSTIRTTDLLTAMAGVAAMFLGYLFLFVVFDQWVVRDGFGPAWRWFLLSTLVISTISWLVWKVGIASFRSVNGLFAAREIEKAEPELKSNLLNLIDLKAAGRDVNPAIIRAMERRAAVRLQQVDVSNAVDHRPLVRTSYVLLAVIVMFCLYALLSPKKISNSIWRGLLPAAEVPLATRTEILSVKPGDITVPAHTQSVEVQVDLGGEIPHQVWLVYTSDDGKFNREPVELRVEAEGQTRFKGQVVGESTQGLMQDLTYSIKAGDAESATYKITVEQPPSANVENIRIEFPAYMRLQPVEQANNGQIDAWEGAKVLINAKTNMPVRMGMIQFMDDPQTGPTGEEETMSVTAGGRQLQGTLTLSLRSDGTCPKYYRIDCKTEDGRRDTAPTNYGLMIRPDLPPEVALLQPDRDLESPANGLIPLLIQARDPDFELSYLYLNIEKAGQRIVREQLSEGRIQQLMLKHELSLARLNVMNGDLLELWIEAYDNKQPKPNTRNTPKIKVRVLEPVSKKDVERQLAEQNDRLEQKLAEAERDINTDQAEQGMQPDADSKERQKPNETALSETDQKQLNKNKEEQPQQDQTAQSQNKSSDTEKQGQSGDQPTAAGQTKSASKSDKGSRPNDTAKADESKGDHNSTKPLSSDGSQDDLAIKRLVEKFEQNAKKSTNPNESKPLDEADPKQEPATQKPQDTSSETEKPDRTSRSQNETTGSKQVPNNDGRKTNESPTVDTSTEDQSKHETPVGNQPETEKPRHGQPKDEKPKWDQRKVDKSTSKDDPAKDSMKDQNTSNQKEGLTSDKDRSEKDKQTKTGEKNGAEKNRTDNAKADPNSSDSKPEVDNPDDGIKKADQQKPEDKSNQPANDNKTDKKAATGKNDSKQQSSKGESEKSKTESQKPNDDNLPAGLNENNPKQETSPDGSKGKTKTKNSDSNTPPKAAGEQVPDSPDSVKKPADGTESGTAKPDQDPDSKTGTSKNDKVKRDPNEKPAMRPEQSPRVETRESDEKQSNNSESAKKPGKGKEPRSDDGLSKPTADPDEMKDADGKASKEDPPSHDEKPNSKPGSESRTNEQPKGDAQGDSKNSLKSKETKSKKADGSTNDDSNSSEQAPPGMKPDGKTPSKDQNSTASDDSSTGKSVNKSESKESGDKKSNNVKKSDDKQSKDSESKDGKTDEGKKGGDEKSGSGTPDHGAKSDKSESESGKGGKGAKGKGDEQGKGDPGGKPSNEKGTLSKPGKPGNSFDGQGGTGSEGEGSTTNGGETPDVGPGEDANLEYNRQATELVLQKLKNELERGDVDSDVLEQLGWNQAEMQQFADRLSKYLEESKRAEESPEAKARQQQFQEMLKNLDLQKSGSKRSGEKEPKREISQVQSKRTPIPPAYRQVYEKFTRDLARQKAETEKQSGK